MACIFKFWTQNIFRIFILQSEKKAFKFLSKNIPYVRLHSCGRDDTGSSLARG